MTTAHDSGLAAAFPFITTSETVSAGSETMVLPTAAELLHAVVLRPPQLRWDGRAYEGARLTELDVQAAERTPGVVQVVVRQNFIGVIASQLGQAQQARARLQPHWAIPVDATPSGATPSTASDQPISDACHASSASRPCSETTAQAGAFARAYRWQSNATATASWATAHFTGRELRIWARTRQPRLLQEELARLCSLDAIDVRLFPNDQLQGEGYDVAADAALLAMACGKPVRVQDEGAGWVADEPVHLNLSVMVASVSLSVPTGASPSIPVALPSGSVTFDIDRPIGRRLSLAALLCGAQGQGRALMAVQTPAYLPLNAAESATILSAPVEADLDGLPAAAQVFAQESFFDEFCRHRGLDPVQARLDALQDPNGRALVMSVAKRAQWIVGTSSLEAGSAAEVETTSIGQGRGFAYSHVIDQSQEPPREVWSAWVADVHVDMQTGQMVLTNLTVGHNVSDLTQVPSTRLEDQMRQAAARYLPHETQYDSWGSEEAAAAEFPVSATHTEVQLVAEGGPLGLAWGPHAELPAAAAIANAIQDATGIRLRQLPFDPETLRARLAPATARNGVVKKAAWAVFGGAVATLGAVLLSAMPWRGAIGPVTVDTSIYSAAAIERGRLVAAAGDCMVCHTAKNGAANAGGLALDTPFGTIYTTNITPDKKTGIGAWSFAAFDRAMRQGIGRDGHHLYPAFPYTAFAKMSDPDMQALYAYLMTREPVSNTVPKTDLPFPYGVRPLVAGWNLLFHKDQPFRPDPGQSTLWNRGAYLVQGAGHCGACHSPRNALGAEKSGIHNFLAGGFAEGWEAPPLNTLSKSPIPWDEAELYRYLRTGYSPVHGTATGPMAPVVHSMASLPDADIRAMAHYLATLAPPNDASMKPALRAAQLEDRSRGDIRVQSLAGENLFEGACAMCHDARSGPPLFGARPSLALNSNLQSDRPDNVIQILLHGISHPAAPGLGYMPSFGDSMNDEQLTELLVYLRQRFAPDRPAWNGLAQTVHNVRSEAHP